MRCSALLRKGVHTVTVKDPRALPVPCAQRYTLKLAKARLWNETLDEHSSGAWQLEDDRHMSPEFDSFMGRSMRGMRPGLDDTKRADMILKQPLPNNSHLEWQARHDMPMAENMYMGSQLHDMHVHGTSLPGLYRIKKDLQKAQRNDKKPSKKQKGLNIQGTKSPPSGWEPIPDGEEDDD